MIGRRRLLTSSLFAAGFAFAKPRLKGQTSTASTAASPKATSTPSFGRRAVAGKGQKYLFIDDQDIEAIDNLARRLHQPQKFANNVVIRPEYRWENAGIQIRTTPIWLADEGIFKMIYLTSAEGPDPGVTLDVTGAPKGSESYACYATSVDGINWEKPFLRLHDYPALTWRGTPVGKENNIIPSANGLLQGPIYDPHDPNPRRRFKGLRYGGGKLQSMASGDFLNWETLSIPTLPSQDESHLTYDAEQRLFIAAVKRRGPYGRSWHLITSPDFEHWQEHGLIFHADQVDQENGNARLRRFFDDPAYLKPIYNRPEEWRTDVYNFPIFPYEGLYLATPVMHHWSGKHAPMYENVDSRKSVELAASRDLRHWVRVAERTPFLEMSPVGDGSAYDTGQILMTNEPVVRNNQLWFYYLGIRHRSQTLADTLQRKYLDSSALSVARLRMDGFVSLKGGPEWGSVSTKPIKVTSQRLRVNCDSWRGRVLAEVVDADSGQAIPGFSRADSVPAIIDSIDQPMRWKTKNDLAELRGKTVKLRFHLWNAEVYSFWIAG
ncbi:MAG: hypothetical protein FJW26_02315 [Acidimicrobiia bacterium]|nr:hypothetical protein [Acidimicrobiia bacterium]